MLVSFFTRLYRGLTEVFCWILLIGAAIGMGIVFADSFRFDGAAFVGGIVGLLIALIFEMLVIPPLMVLFEINDKLEKNKNNSVSVVKSDTVTSPKVTAPLTATEKLAFQNGNTWVCRKCGETNANGAALCRSCGK